MSGHEGHQRTHNTNALAGPSTPRTVMPSDGRKRRRRSISHPDGPQSDASPDLEWYVADFNEHTKASRECLVGRISLVKGQALCKVFTASSLAPGKTIWSATEKGKFFAALSRHSRLRPDLIARDIGTKTEAEVDGYLSLLRRAQRQLKERKLAGNESRKWRYHLLGIGSTEVGDEWVAVEESLGSELESIAPVPSTHGNDDDELQKWGRDIDVDALDHLDTLIVGPEDIMGSESRSRSATPAPANLEEIPSLDDPAAYEAHEAAEISSIEDIQKGDRTSDQRTQLRILINRRRNRTKYRMNVLIKEGYTREQIESHGGADAVFLDSDRRIRHRSGTKVEDLSQSGGTKAAEAAPIDEEVVRLSDMGAGAFCTERGWDIFHFSHMAQAMEMYAEARAATGGLENSGRNRNSSGLTTGPTRHDESTSRGSSDSDSTRSSSPPPDEATTSAPSPSLSFTVLEQLYAELVAYLKPLVHESIICAENETVQRPEQEAGISDVRDVHVRTVLALRGEARPKVVMEELLAGYKDDGRHGTRNGTEDSHRGNTPRGESSRRSRSRSRLTPAPDRDDLERKPRASSLRGSFVPYRNRTLSEEYQVTPWSTLRGQSARGRSTKRELDWDRGSDSDSEASSIVSTALDSDSDAPSTGGETDDEDAALDRALNRTDEALDGLVAARLERSLAEHGDRPDPVAILREAEKMGGSWFVDSDDNRPNEEDELSDDEEETNGTNLKGEHLESDTHAVARKRKRSHSSDHNDMGAMRKLAEAQSRYKSLLIQVQTAQRSRRHARTRATRFSTTRLMVEGQHMRSKNALIMGHGSRGRMGARYPRKSGVLRSEDSGSDGDDEDDVEAEEDVESRIHIIDDDEDEVDSDQEGRHGSRQTRADYLDEDDQAVLLANSSWQDSDAESMEAEPGVEDALEPEEEDVDMDDNYGESQDFVVVPRR